jgi:hypothetical protein
MQIFNLNLKKIKNFKKVVELKCKHYLNNFDSRNSRSRRRTVEIFLPRTQAVPFQTTSSKQNWPI